MQAAERIDYEASSFDVVVGIDILHHVEVEQAIEQVYRVLKPHGVAVFREWIDVPVFGRVRETALVRRLFPKASSIDTHITVDEKKLDKRDIAAIVRRFPKHDIQRFMVFSRLRRLLAQRETEPSRLEMLDYYVMTVAPFLRHLGGEIVLVLTK